MLSSQFNALAGKLNDPEVGGFTANPRRGGGSPRSKYLVGQRDVPEGKHAMPSRGEDIEAYARSNASTLSHRDRHLGGWAEGDTAYLDVPKGFPRTPVGEVSARLSSLDNDQIAYGEMNSRGKYAGTTYNPHHPLNQHEIQAQPQDAGTWARMPLHAAQFPKGGRKLSLKNQSFS